MKNWDLYRCLKHRIGGALRSQLNRRGLVSNRKTLTYQPTRNESSFSGPTILQNDFQEHSSSNCLRQHLSGVVHKQTGRHKICRTLLSDVENPDLVQPQQYHTQSNTCTRITQCDSGQPPKEESDPAHRVVSISTGLQTNLISRYGIVFNWTCLQPA